MIQGHHTTYVGIGESSASSWRPWASARDSHHRGAAGPGGWLESAPRTLRTWSPAEGRRTVHWTRDRGLEGASADGRYLLLHSDRIGWRLLDRRTGRTQSIGRALSVRLTPGALIVVRDEARVERVRYVPTR